MLNLILFCAKNSHSHSTNHSSPMKITAQSIDQILRAMTAKNLSQVALAELVGVHRTYINKILRGLLPTIPDEMADKLSDKLGISLNPLQFEEGPVSATALKLTAHAAENPDFSALLETLVTLQEGAARKAVIPSVETKYLAKIGAELTRIVHRWEEGADPHYAKIAAEALTYLREFFRNGRF